MATISNSYKPITTSNPGILGLKNKIKIGSDGYVAPIIRSQQNATVQTPVPQPTSQVSAPVQPSGSPIIDIPAPNRGLFNNVKDSIQQPKQNPLTFGGLVGDIRGASNPSSGQNRYIKQIAEVGSQNKALGQKAEDLSQKYGSEIARIGQLGAGAVAGSLSTGTNVVGAGNAAIASQSASSRMNALAQGQNAELSGIEKQLAANQAERAGLESALSGSQFQQTSQLGGLGTAASLAAPSGNYPFTFDPLTGGFGQSGSGAILNPQQAAQDVISGKTGYEQAKAALSYLGGTGEAQLQAAITAAGGDPLRLQAQGAATAQNIGTQNTAQTDIARAGLADATQNYVTMNAGAQYAGQQAQAVSSILERTGLNNVSSNDYNKVVNSIRGRFSDPDFASLNTALQEARAAYTQLLSSTGGTPSGREEIALSTLDTNSTPAKINASIHELENAVARRLQAQYGAMQTYQQNLGGGQSYGGSSSGGSGGLFDF